MNEKRSAPELDEILANLPKDSKLVSLEFWSMGWIAFLEVQGKNFELVSDKGYIDVYQVVGDQINLISPPAEQKYFVSTSQVVQLILKSNTPLTPN